MICTVPKLLILITSCHQNQSKRTLIRKTWIRQLPLNQPYFFVVGDGNNEIKGDTLEVDASDACDQCIKMHKSIEYWLRNSDFDYIFYCDDDTYIVPDRLLDCPFYKHDYYGCGLTSSDNKNFYVDGGAGMFISRKAAKVITAYLIDKPFVTDSKQSDMMVGKILKHAGIQPQYAPQLYFNYGQVYRGVSYPVIYPIRMHSKIIACHDIPHPDRMMYVAIEMNPLLAFDRVFWLNPDHSETVQDQITTAGITHMVEEFYGTMDDLIQFCKDQKSESFVVIKNDTRFADGIIDLLIEPIRSLMSSKEPWDAFDMGGVLAVHERGYDLPRTESTEIIRSISSKALVMPQTEKINYPIKVAMIVNVFYRGGAESEFTEMILNSDPAKVKYVGIAVEYIKKFEAPKNKNFPKVYGAGRKVDGIEICDSFNTAVAKAIADADIVVKWHTKNEFVESLPHPSILLSNTFSGWVRNCYKNLKADYYIGNSDHSCKVFPKHAENIETIYSGRNPERVKVTSGRNHQRSCWMVKPQENMAIYTGRLKLDKNLKTIIKAVALLPNWKLALVGQPDDYDYPDILHLCKKYLPDRYIIETWQASLGDMLAAADVFVLASDYEGFSNSLAEAWLAGLPTVFTRCGAVMELTEKYGKIGTDVPVNVSPENLANKIEEAFENKNSDFVKRAKEMILEFTMEKSAKDWQDVYERLYVKRLSGLESDPIPEIVDAKPSLKTPKVLILITNCQQYKLQKKLIQQTWIRQLPPTQQYLFVVGGDKTELNGDTLQVISPDDYDGQCIKMHMAINYCINNIDFDYIFYCDDDTYIVPDRLLDCPFYKYDYYGPGPVQSPEPWSMNYVQGGTGVFLSKKACRAIVEYPIDGTHVVDSPWSDMMIAKIMSHVEIKPTYAESFYFHTGIGSPEDNRKGIARPAYPHRIRNRYAACHKMPHPTGMILAAQEMNPFLAFEKIFCSDSHDMENQYIEAGIAHLVEEFDGNIEKLVQQCKEQNVSSFLLIDNKARFVDGVIDFMIDPLKSLCKVEWDIFSMGCELNGATEIDEYLIRVTSGQNHPVLGVHKRAYDHILENHKATYDFNKWISSQNHLSIFAPQRFTVETEQSAYDRHGLVSGAMVEYPIKVAIVISVFYRGGTEYEIMDMIANSDPSKIQYIGIAVENITYHGIPNGPPYFEVSEQIRKLCPNFYCGQGTKNLEGIEVCGTFEKAIEKATMGADIVVKLSVKNDHLNEMPQPSILISNIFSRWLRGIYKDAKADYYIGNSDHSCKSFPQYAKEVMTIYSGRKEDRVRMDIGRDKQRSNWGIGPDERVVIYTGRLNLDKNLREIIKAVSILSGYKLVLVGEPCHSQREISNLCQKYLPHRYRIVGWQRNIGDALAAADIFVMVSDYEGFSNSLAEAWLAGVPTVFSRCGSVMEITEKYGKIGTEVPVNVSPEQLAEKIEEAWKNRNEPFVHHVQSVMKNDFTTEKSIAKWQSTFERLYREKSTDILEIGLVDPPQDWVVPKYAPRNRVKFCATMPVRPDLVISFSNSPSDLKCPVLLVGTGQKLTEEVCKTASFFCATDDEALNEFPEVLRKSVRLLEDEEYGSLTSKKWLTFIEKVMSRTPKEPLRKTMTRILGQYKTKVAATKLNVEGVAPPSGHLEWTYLNVAEVAEGLGVPYKH